MMKKVIIIISMLLATAAYPQSNNRVLLHSENVTASKSKCELYSSAELKSNSKVIFSIIITAESPTPLAKYNVIGEGSAVLVVPEDAKVDYGKIKLLWSDSETGDNLKPYTPPGWVEKKARELAKELAGTLFDQIPVIGSIMGMVFSFMPELPVNQNNDIDANEYDLVTMSWESSIMRIAKRIRVDIPVQLGESKSCGLFATWTTKEKNNTGPEYTKVNTITPGLKLNPAKGMVFVEGGTFTMGYKDGDYEEGLRKVTVNSFLIAKFEVTQTLWESVMTSNPSHWEGSERPVEGVSWYEAVEFCNKLSVKEGLIPVYKINKNKIDPNNKNEFDKLKWLITADFSANGYRLPTEAEWEYAARGGRESRGYRYSGSNKVEDVGWYGGWANAGRRTDGGEGTSEVGKLKPNELGIYDMSGNVFEWCWDWFSSDAYSSTTKVNPKGPVSGEDHVMRGGCWFSDEIAYLNVGYRDHWHKLTYKGGDFGFRLVRSK